MKINKRAVLNWLKNVFTKNIGMKIGAVVLAFLLWSFVIAEQDPVRVTTFQNVPLNYTGLDDLREKGLTTVEQPSDVLNKVSMTVEATANKMSELTEAMLSAEVDLSTVTDAGERTFTITPRSTMRNLTMRTDPTEVTLTIEQIESKSVPVEVQVTGERADDLYYGEPVLMEGTIEVTGALSNVEQVARAICYIDVTGITEPKNETRTVTLVSNDGTELSSGMFTGIPSVIVEIPIYPMESLPVDLENVKQTITGLAEGYEIISIRSEPDTVSVAGRKDVLAELEKVKLDAVTLENGGEGQVVTVRVPVPEGAFAVTPAEVEVYLEISPLQAETTYSAQEVGYKNLGEGLEASLQPETVDVVVKGAKSSVDALTSGDILPFVDLQNLEAGIYNVEIKFENEPDLGLTSITPSGTTIQVEINAVE